MELLERSIDNNRIQETEDRFSDNAMEVLDDITMPEIGLSDPDEEMQSHSEEDPSKV